MNRLAALALAVSTMSCRLVLGIEDVDSVTDATKTGADAREPDASHDAAIDAPLDAPNDATIDAALVCPSEYVDFGGWRYRAVTSPDNWLDAAEDCANDSTSSTHLAVISSPQELVAIKNVFLGAPRWIGLSDRRGGVMQWVTTEAAEIRSTYWAGSEPTGAVGEDCVYMIEHMYDATCLEAQAYVCECDGIANDPTRY